MSRRRIVMFRASAVNAAKLREASTQRTRHAPLTASRIRTGDGGVARRLKPRYFKTASPSRSHVGSANHARGASGARELMPDAYSSLWKSGSRFSRNATAASWRAGVRPAAAKMVVSAKWTARMLLSVAFA